MNFTRFSPATTYIFPQVNGTTGGQILSEYNMRCRESVGTNPNVPYMIGASYTHSMNDFSVSMQTDGIGAVISSTAIQINPGRALVNGHFVESATPVIVDIAVANSLLNNGDTPLRGTLCIGLRAMYSSDPATFGTLIGTVDKDGYFEGIQVVVLPKSEFILPSSDVGIQDASLVTAHLKLAEFTYVNGAVNADSIVQNADKVQIFDASRVGQIEQKLAGKYVTVDTLNPQNFYVMQGNGDWCASNGSLMLWDKNDKAPIVVPDGQTISDVTRKTEFLVDANTGKTFLNVTHKQPHVRNSANKLLYLPDAQLELPLADYDRNTSGTVNGAYTAKLKDAVKKLNDIHRSVTGKQRWFLDVLDDVEDLPDIEQNWEIGDYVVVRQDNTVTTYAADVAQPPSTMYVIIHGQVTGIDYQHVTTTQPETNGMQLGKIMTGKGSPSTLRFDPDTGYIVCSYNSDTIKLWNATYYDGVPNEDYFCYNYKPNDDEDGTLYYVLVSSAKKRYSDAIYLTGSIPFAQEAIIGGFLNVPETATDQGYIYLDDTGHLRLLDYGLLRSGTLAYQLGEDFTSPGGITIEEVQNNLDEYVNNRVAFPTDVQKANAIANGEPEDVIKVDITLDVDDTSDEVQTLTIRDIDSRFGTSVHLFIHSANNLSANIVINIINCEKIRINSTIPGSPTINVINSCLYYDADVIGRLGSTVEGRRFGVSDLSFWYARYDTSDPDLIVNGLDIYAPNVTADTNISALLGETDPHYNYAIRGIKFDHFGNIIGMSLFFNADITVSGSSAENPNFGDFIFTDKFKLVPSINMPFPTNRLNKHIKINGIYNMAYKLNEENSYVFAESNFTIITPTYTSTSEVDEEGMIGIKMSVLHIDNAPYMIPEIVSSTPQDPVVIDCWQAGSYAVYEGYTYG